MTPTDLYALAKDFIASLGFPIFVACYLLIYHKKSLDRLTEAIQALKDSIEALYGQAIPPH